MCRSDWCWVHSSCVICINDLVDNDNKVNNFADNIKNGGVVDSKQGHLRLKQCPNELRKWHKIMSN